MDWDKVYYDFDKMMMRAVMCGAHRDLCCLANRELFDKVMEIRRIHGEDKLWELVEVCLCQAQPPPALPPAVSYPPATPVSLPPQQPPVAPPVSQPPMSGPTQPPPPSPPADPCGSMPAKNQFTNR
jgi:hypothetical protein